MSLLASLPVRDTASVKPMPEQNARYAGIEIEMESLSHDTYTSNTMLQKRWGNNTDWEIVGDGSLRNNGIEFRTAGGIGMPHAQAIRSLGQITWAFDANVIDTFRVGVHYNADVSDYTYRNIVQLILFSSLLSDSIFDMSGGSRDQGNFCVPWKCMQAHLLPIVEDILTGTGTSSLRSKLQHFPKYSEINLMSAQSRGCVEFRHLPTPYGDVWDTVIPRIRQYSEVCNELVQAASSGTYEAMSYKEAVDSFFDSLTLDYGSYKDRHPHLRALVERSGISEDCMLATTSLLTAMSYMTGGLGKGIDLLSLCKTVLWEPVTKFKCKKRVKWADYTDTDQEEPDYESEESQWGDEPEDL